MLYTGETFRRVVVFVVDMYVIVAYGLACFGREKVVVNEGLGGLAGKFHHHSRWRIGVHVGILAGDVVVLRFDYFEEHVAGFCLAGDAALVAVGYVAAGNLFAGAVHEFELDTILNLFYGHAF